MKFGVASRSSDGCEKMSRINADAQRYPVSALIRVYLQFLPLCISLRFAVVPGSQILAAVIPARRQGIWIDVAENQETMPLHLIGRKQTKEQCMAKTNKNALSVTPAPVATPAASNGAPDANASLGMAGGAAAGAAAGALMGPVGAAVGAIVGGIAGANARSIARSKPVKTVVSAAKKQVTKVTAKKPATKSKKKAAPAKTAKKKTPATASKKKSPAPTAKKKASKKSSAPKKKAKARK